MNSLLFTTMLAQASSLYNTSNIEIPAEVPGIFGAVAGVFSIFMVITSILPVIVFGLAFFLIFKSIKQQGKMRNDMDNITREAQNRMNNINNMNTTPKTEPTPQYESKPKYESPINTDPNGVIDLDNVLDANNTDPIKKN